MAGSATSRRRVEELKTLYRVQPALKDVVGEGRTDARLIRWYLHEHGLRHVKVYAIDDRVEIPSEMVFAAGGEVGARGRVLALAAEAATWELIQTSLTCVIDYDRDCFLPSGSPPQAHLLRTDVGSLDVYAFQPRPMQQFIDLVSGRADGAAELIAQLLPALNELFLVRSALHADGVALVSNYGNCCDTGSEPTAVDAEKLVRRSLAVVGAGRSFGATVARVEALRSGLPSDSLLAVRGHDIPVLLVKRLGLKNEWARPEVVETTLRACLSTADLDDYPLFRRLRERCLS